MSKKKKNKFRADQSSSTPAPSTVVPAPVPLAAPAPSIPLSAQDPVSVGATMRLDAMEERIRGEELLMQHESAGILEEQRIKKALNDKEVDRRLEELRRKLGLK